MEHMRMNGKSTNERNCAMWHRRTIIEKCLIVICFILFVVFLVLMGLLIHRENTYKKEQKETICLSNACKEEAGRMLANMDFSTDPCEDFYKFSCGSFMKYETIFDTWITHEGNLMDYVIQLSKEVLEKPNEEGDPKFYGGTKMYYQACLKRSKSTKEVIEAFLEKTGLKFWLIPNTNKDVDSSKFSLEEAMAIVHVYGYTNPLISLHRNNKNILGIYPGLTILLEKHLLNERLQDSLQIKEQYKSLMVYIFSMMGLTKEEVQTEMEEIFNFETELANISMKRKSLISEKTVTIGELQAQCNEIQWTKLLNNIYAMHGRITLYNDNIRLDIASMEYMKDLCHLIGTIDSRIVRNYIIWNFLLEYLVQFDDFLLALVRTGSYSISEPVIKGRQDWKYCIEYLQDSYFRTGLDFMLIKSLPTEEIIKEVILDAENIRTGAIKILSKQDWINPSSREILGKKLKDIRFVVGYSEGFLDKKMVNRIFDEVKVTEDHLENLLNSGRALAFNYMFNDSSVSSLYNMRLTHPLAVHAVYHPPEIGVPLGMLFPPYFAQGVPKYINYAGLGVTLARRMSLEFETLDNDKKGKLSEKLIEKFKDKYNCLKDQYSELPRNENETLDGSSAIVDNSAVLQAFSAYEEYIKSKEEPQLPALDFTNRQMFFIKHAQLHCSIIDSTIEHNFGNSANANKFRALIPLMNMQAFSEAFHCPVNSFMNLVQKCQIWE